MCGLLFNQEFAFKYLFANIELGNPIQIMSITAPMMALMIFSCPTIGLIGMVEI